MTHQIQWARRHPNGYEMSSKGDARFSALNAKMPDERTIEQWYQCDIKFYQPKGRDWRLGKGKPSLIEYPGDGQWQMYLSLWRIWVIHNSNLFMELSKTVIDQNKVLTDCFANSEINQARALATIINEWVLTP